MILVLLGFVHSAVSAAGPPPPYTYVEVEIEANTGKVTDAHLTKSTGDAILDAKLLESFRKWRFKPKKKPQRVKMPILLAHDKK